MSAAQELAPVAAYLESMLGLSFGGPRRERLVAVMEAQRAAAGMSPEDFLAAVSRPGQALDRLVAEVTVGETYFYRDRVQCDLLRTVVLPSLAADARPDHPMTLWSAGCASGEEAFTLAALAEGAATGGCWFVVGSDASRRAVDKARRAEYGRWSMRSISQAEITASFIEQDGRFHVADRLRRRTRFLQRNLLDGPPPPGRFDVVLCRNVLIYLTPDAVRRAAEVLHSALTPRGWLITGAGDPLLQADGLEVVRTPYGLAYRRASHMAKATRRRQVVAAPEALPRATPARRMAAPARDVAGVRAPAVQAHVSPGLSPAHLAGRVRSLGDGGHLDEACLTAEAAVRAHPLDVELRYLAAVVLLEAGRLDDALSEASAAVYLGPRLAATHLLLGQVQHARGNADRARRSFRNGSRLLAASPAEAAVALAGDVPAGHLAAIAARYLSTLRTRP